MARFFNTTQIKHIDQGKPDAEERYAGEQTYDSMDQIPNGSERVVEFYKLQSLKQVNHVYNEPYLYYSLSEIEIEHLAFLKEHFTKLESAKSTPGLTG